MTKHVLSCLHCGGEFTAKRNDAKYCSNSHRVLAYLERSKIPNKNKEYVCYPNNISTYPNTADKLREEINALLLERQSLSMIQERNKVAFEKLEAEMKKSSEEYDKAMLQRSITQTRSDIQRIITKFLGYHHQGKILFASLNFLRRRIKDVISSRNYTESFSDPEISSFLHLNLIEFLKKVEKDNASLRKTFVPFQIPEDLLAELETTSVKLK